MITVHQCGRSLCGVYRPLGCTSHAIATYRTMLVARSRVSPPRHQHAVLKSTALTQASEIPWPQEPTIWTHDFTRTPRGYVNWFGIQNQRMKAFVDFVKSSALLKIVQRRHCKLMQHHILHRHKKPYAVSHANSQGHDGLVGKLCNSSILDEASDRRRSFIVPSTLPRLTTRSSSPG